jgi:ribonuclease HI
MTSLPIEIKNLQIELLGKYNEFIKLSKTDFFDKQDKIREQESTIDELKDVIGMLRSLLSDLNYCSEDVDRYLKKRGKCPECYSEKCSCDENSEKDIKKSPDISVLWVDGACNSDTKDCAWGSVVNNEKVDIIPLYKNLSKDLIYEEQILKINKIPTKREIIIAKATDVKSQQNNYAELLSFLFTLRIANVNKEVKEIKSDSDLIIKYWSNPEHNTNMTKDDNKNKYIKECKKLRKIFESNKGKITKVDGKVNLADLGKHKN